MKKIIGLLMVLSLILGFGLAGCSNGAGNGVSGGNGGGGDGGDSGGSSESGGKTNISFWHSMSGHNGEILNGIVEDFNKQSDSVHVKAVYQGGYTDSLTKLRAVGGSDQAPAIVQVFDIGTKYMSQSGFITPMQKFIDEHDFDVSNIVKPIRSYYTIDDKLYSMPFNSSNAIMYYNKDMFKKAGLDPNDPPSTFGEMKKAAQQIKSKTGHYGFTMATIGWFFEQLMANQGALYINEENGRAGEPTKALVNSKYGLNIFNWLNDMNKAGTFKNYGNDWSDASGPFYAGQVGMFFGSTAIVKDAINNASFEVGTAFLPVPDGMKPKGVIIGGASVWITNKVSEDQQEAAWKFIKYLSSPKAQATWATGTGYFPVNTKSYDLDSVQKVYEKYPQYKTAVKQLRNTKTTPATSGALTTVMPQARNIIEDAMGKLYQGTDPQKALDQAAEQITNALKKK